MKKIIQNTNNAIQKTKEIRKIQNTVNITMTTECQVSLLSFYIIILNGV